MAVAAVGAAVGGRDHHDDVDARPARRTARPATPSTVRNETRPAGRRRTARRSRRPRNRALRPLPAAATRADDADRPVVQRHDCVSPGTARSGASIRNRASAAVAALAQLFSE